MLGFVYLSLFTIFIPEMEPVVRPFPHSVDPNVPARRRKRAAQAGSRGYFCKNKTKPRRSSNPALGRQVLCRLNEKVLDIFISNIRCSDDDLMCWLLGGCLPSLHPIATATGGTVLIVGMGSGCRLELWGVTGVPPGVGFVKSRPSSGKFLYSAVLGEHILT